MSVVVLVLLIIAFVVGSLGAIRSRGEDLAAWGVIALSLALLVQRWA
jgi:hypothetical protein